MKSFTLLVLVAFAILPNLARAEAKPQEIIGATMASCVVGAGFGAAVGGMISGVQGAKTGVKYGCGGAGTFAAGVGISKADESAPNESSLDEEVSEVDDNQ